MAELVVSDPMELSHKEMFMSNSLEKYLPKIRHCVLLHGFFVHRHETHNKVPIKLWTHEQHTFPKTFMSCPQYLHVMTYLSKISSKWACFASTQNIFHLLYKHSKLTIQQVHKCHTSHRLIIFMLFEHEIKYRVLDFIGCYIVIN